MPVTSYSTTPASNNGSPPNGAPEGWAPSDVNNTVRQIMADIAVEAQVNAVKVLASVAGTNTITGSMTPDLTAYSAGMIVVLTPANNNTGASTLNIDSLGALDVLKNDGDALVSGDLVAGVPAVLVLDSGADDFYLLNPQSGLGDFARLSQSNTFTNAEFLTGVISPSALASGSTNDYAPANFSSARILRLTPNASGSTLTGLAGGAAGRVVTIINIGSSGLLSLTDESASSSAANRFATPAALNSGTCCSCWYDGTSSRWRVFF